MALDAKSMHVRLCHEAHAVFAAEAELRDCDLVEVCRDVLEQWALGRKHNHTVLARRLERAGLMATRRE